MPVLLAEGYEFNPLRFNRIHRLQDGAGAAFSPLASGLTEREKGDPETAKSVQDVYMASMGARFALYGETAIDGERNKLETFRSDTAKSLDERLHSDLSDLWNK